MAIRNIVKIDEEKCNGCGECVIACAEGAIEIIDGKAKLVSEIYCDGLGACLGHCPQDAIIIEQREAAEFDEEATEEHLAQAKKPQKIPIPSAPAEPMECGCPGVMAKTFEKKPAPALDSDSQTPSQLGQWPVQMMLVSPDAPYFKNADLLWAADCVPFAMADFHQRFLAGRAVAVGCPKLDNVEFYIEKLAKIIQNNSLKSLTVVHMEVPCCFGMSHIAKEAVARSGVELTFEDITVDLRGNIIK
ncbi:ATP-binding protein [Planctomycetota bacterium]